MQVVTCLQSGGQVVTFDVHVLGVLNFEVIFLLKYNELEADIL